MNYKVGLAKVCITPDVIGNVMLGYARPKQKVRGVAQDIYSRALCIQSEQDLLFFLNIEICFPTQLLHDALLKNLQKEIPHIEEKNLIITTQHTHSAPGGISAHALYNFSNQGFCPKTFNTYLDGSSRALVKAFKDLKPSTIKLKEGSFHPSEDVAFNRSLNAFQNNKEHKGKESVPSNLAIDRRSKQLEFWDENLRGFINFFGVHCTSLSSKNQLIHPDNKGVASAKSEGRNLKSVCIFAQGYAGDISPNFIPDARSHRGFRGISKDEFTCADFTGHLQHEMSEKLLTKEASQKIEKSLKLHSCYLDFSNLLASKEYEEFYGQENLRTTSGAIGSSMIIGSPSDGLAFNQSILPVFKKVLTSTNAHFFKQMSNEDQADYKNHLDAQAEKVIAIDSGTGMFMAHDGKLPLQVLGAFDPILRCISQQKERGALNTLPWIQEVHKINFFQIDQVLFISIPFEITTTAGFRLENSLKKVIANSEITELIIVPYANSYCGYLVTPEEYEVQTYEGAHCIFGKWILPCFQSALEVELKKFMANSLDENRLRPLKIAQEEIEKRTNSKY